jgi:spermidine synthase
MNLTNVSASTAATGNRLKCLLCLAALLCGWGAAAQTGRQVVFERISQYHHIQVYDENGVRTLSFNGSWETTMSLTNPLVGHFEYTEYFQMPFIWNPDIKRVLMAGLGGGSTQRAFQHYFTNVVADTVEIDPAVVEVAKKYFSVTESPILRIHTNDARQYLRLTTNTYDLILMDAYATTRYGSSLPQQLTTKEFFTIANQRLSTNGVLAYNVIGQIYGYRANLLGALYRTMKEVFPQVYFFPAEESQNVVFVATKSKELYTLSRVMREGQARMSSGLVKLPTFAVRMGRFLNTPPPNANNSIILTDEYSPIESLMNQAGQTPP